MYLDKEPEIGVVRLWFLSDHLPLLMADVHSLHSNHTELTHHSVHSTHHCPGGCRFVQIHYRTLTMLLAAHLEKRITHAL